MDELRTITDIVRYILLMYPNTRDSDNYLYYRVLDILGKRKGIDIDVMPVGQFFLKMKDYGIPSIESVGRARRKLQEKYPEFVSSNSVKSYREQNEAKYREYAREGV